MTVLGAEARRAAPTPSPRCTARSRAPCGRASIPAGPKTQCRSATSPTASTSPPGSRRRCASLYDRHLGAGLAAAQRRPRAPGKPSRTSTTASCGRRTSALKAQLLDFARRRAVEQAERRGESPDVVAAARARSLSPDALTIGFARRFATYKRANLLLNDIERLAAHGQRSQAPGAVRLRRQGPSARRARQARPAADRRADARLRTSPTSSSSSRTTTSTSAATSCRASTSG